METVNHTSVKWVYTKEFGSKLVPLIYFDGKLTFTVNQWIQSLIDEDITPSALDRYIRAITHFFNFYNALYVSTQKEPPYRKIMAMFLDAKRYGTDEYCSSTSHPFLNDLFLGWKPSSIRNIRSNYLNILNEFDKWQSVFQAAERINPSEERLLSTYEKFQNFKNREKWDALLHLSPSRSNTKEAHNVTLQRSHKRLQKLRERTEKSFPPDKFIELIESLKNPRDKLLCLILGGGSLRGSEPLHLFHDDFIGQDNDGQLLIRLSDPDVGEYTWENENGKQIVGTRATYITQNYKNEHLGGDSPLRNLSSRTAYSKVNSGFSAGFKGMTFTEDTDDNDKGEHYLFWSDPRLGRYAYKVYLEYRDNYITINKNTGKPNPKGWPHHPWFFINIDKVGYGMPFTVSAFKKMWERSKKRLGLKGKRLGRHSLRHLFGFYCANVLNLSLADIMTYMHHSDPSSTKVYVSLSKENVRQKLLDTFNGETKSLAIVNLSNSFKYKIPKEWF